MRQESLRFEPQVDRNVLFPCGPCGGGGGPNSSHLVLRYNSVSSNGLPVITVFKSGIMREHISAASRSHRELPSHWGICRTMSAEDVAI